MNRNNSTASLILLLFAASVFAGHDEDPRTRNLHPMGHIEEEASLFAGTFELSNIHTDIAFWGRYAFQGSWFGFNVRDISKPGNPIHVSFTECLNGGNIFRSGQGDVLVWEHILVRSWDQAAKEGALCDGEVVPVDFEGLHIFDISDVNNVMLIGSVELLCGSHTATAVPDPDNDRLLVYNSGSDEDCMGIEIVQIPLSNPGAARQINFIELERDCHDIGVILGNAMMAACAGDDGFAVLDLSATFESPGATLESPVVLYDQVVPGVLTGHSAAFTWDGELIVFGHEPDGGGQARCKVDDVDFDKSFFFFAARTGDLLGTWVLPRPQLDTENCTLHNLNVVPIRSGNYVLVHGSYQSGTSVVDFTDPTNAVELAYSDPPPLDPLDVGGPWASYWYNNFIYETNITEGLNIFRYSGRETAGAIRLDHLNPQTQMFTID